MLDVSFDSVGTVPVDEEGEEASSDDWDCGF